ncbi:MAG: hypothetical protein ACOCXP_02655 [Candidatus Dojkabacteria bacterium]
MKIYYGVNLLASFVQGKSLGGDLAKIKDEILPQFGEVIEWFGTGEVEDMREIYNYDRGCVEKSDVMIAEVSNPSHGVGMEIMYAITLGKPLVAIAHADAHVSRMVQGIDYERFVFMRYEDFADLEVKLGESFQKLGLEPKK